MASPWVPATPSLDGLLGATRTPAPRPHAAPAQAAVGLRLGAGEPSTGTTLVREPLHRAWRGREACPCPSHTRHGTRDGRRGVPGVGVRAVQDPSSHGACAVAPACGTPLTSGACAMASGPWDPGAPSLDISCRPCLYADTTCSIWFSRRSLAPGCGRTCASLRKHSGHSATYMMLKLIFIMILRGPAVKSSSGPSLPARHGIPS